MKKKLLKAGLTALCILAGCAVLVTVLSCAAYSPEYVFRCVAYGPGDVSDYRIFPERTVSKSETPYRYEYELDESIADLPVQYTSGGSLMQRPLDELARRSGTMSLIVVHGDKVVFERYYNGCDSETVNTSFSMAKSVVSLLVGTAIDEGFIQSETQKITDYISEFNGTEFSDITIRDLLTMRSPIRYREGGAWFGDDAMTYYFPDLRRLALTGMRNDAGYDGRFLYNNYHPLLLGLILERATGMRVSEYFQTRIWEKIGAEHDASWSLDSKASQFEKMESGINFKAIDFVKIGSTLLHGGQWNGGTLVSADWLSRSLVAPAPVEGRIFGYQYMWYSIDNAKNGKDYFMSGRYGQFLYVSPENDTVILRTGTGEGGVDIWPVVLLQLAEATGN